MRLGGHARAWQCDGGRGQECSCPPAFTNGQNSVELNCLAGTTLKEAPPDIQLVGWTCGNVFKCFPPTNLIRSEVPIKATESARTIEFETVETRKPILRTAPVSVRSLECSRSCYAALQYMLESGKTLLGSTLRNTICMPSTLSGSALLIPRTRFAPR